MGFLRDFGGGAKIFGGNPPRNAMTSDLRRLVKKNYGDTVNTLIIIIIIIIIRRFVWRHNMSVKSLQGRRTENTLPVLSYTM